MQFRPLIETFLSKTTRSRASNEFTGGALATSVGRVRLENQDRAVYVCGNAPGERAEIQLAVVSDGMGGMANGARAAEIACAAFVDAFLRSSGDYEARLCNAALEADRQVFNELRGKGGATLVAALIREDCIHFVSVGDSRIYSFARESGLLQLTRDDTLDEVLRGSRSPEREVDRGSQLIQFIGLGEGVEPHASSGSADSETSWILTSDGAHSCGHELLGRICKANPVPARLSEAIVATANALGGGDNATALVLRKKQPNDPQLGWDGLALATSLASSELWLVPNWHKKEKCVVEAPREVQPEKISTSDVDSMTPSAPIAVRKARKKPRKKAKAKKLTKTGGLLLDFPTEGD